MRGETLKTAVAVLVAAMLAGAVGGCGEQEKKAAERGKIPENIVNDAKKAAVSEATQALETAEKSAAEAVAPLPGQLEKDMQPKTGEPPSDSYGK